MIVLDTLLIGGIKFVLRRIAEAVDAQLNDVDTLRQELLAAQMRVELGEMSDAEFAEIEGALLARLREIQETAREEGGDAMRIAGVDVSVRDGVDDEPSDAAPERRAAADAPDARQPGRSPGLPPSTSLPAKAAWARRRVRPRRR